MTGGSKSKAKRRSQVVKELLEKVEGKLGEEAMKPTLGDYIRLVQLQRDLEDEEPKEIKVTWVEPEKETKDSSGK